MPLRAHAREEAFSEPVIGEQAVAVGAEHEAVFGDRALRPPVEMEERPRQRRPGAAAHVDFVAGEPVGGPDRHGAFLRLQHRLDVEQAEAGARSRRAFHAVGVGHGPAQHLEAAAEPQHAAAAAQMGADVDIPALVPEEGEVGPRVLAAGQHGEVDVGRQRLAGPEETDADLSGQRVEIVEIGDARIAERGNARRPRRRPVRLQRHGILRRQLPGVLEPGHHAEAGQACQALQRRDRRIEQGGVAPEPVDDIAAEPCRIGGRQHMARAGDRRDDPAPVDVGDQHHRQPGRLGEAHIGDVALAQVDLRSAAGPLDQDEVGIGREPAESAERAVQQAGLQARIVLRIRPPDGAPGQHDLRAQLRFGLQQHRVHVHMRRHAGGARLQRLGAADLAAAGSDRGVVRHVLRLERPDAEAAPRPAPAEPRHDERLAGIGAGPLHHQRPGRHGVAPASRATGTGAPAR